MYSSYKLHCLISCIVGCIVGNGIGSNCSRVHFSADNNRKSGAVIIRNRGSLFRIVAVNFKGDCSATVQRDDRFSSINDVYSSYKLHCLISCVVSCIVGNRIGSNFSRVHTTAGDNRKSGAVIIRNRGSLLVVVAVNF
jgi:hypothetical protein